MKKKPLRDEGSDGVAVEKSINVVILVLYAGLQNVLSISDFRRLKNKTFSIVLMSLEFGLSGQIPHLQCVIIKKAQPYLFQEVRQLFESSNLLV